MSLEQLLVTKQDLVVLQARGFFKSIAEAESVWNELKNRCPVATNSNGNENQAKKAIEEIPSVKGKYKVNEKKYDICLTYSQKNGSSLAKQIRHLLQEQKLRVTLAFENDDITLDSIEQRVAESTCLVVLLTEKALTEVSVVFAMSAGKYYYKHTSQIILVHDAGSCFFPGYDEQPPSLSEIFSEKAITFLSCYADEGVKQIATKFAEESKVLQNSNNRSSVFDQLLRFASADTEEIPVPQFRNIMSSMITEESELDNIIKELDQNGDGKIGTLEFCEMMNKSPKFSSLFSSNDNSSHTQEDITTELFLSHKRSTGQGIAGRLYEGLKSHYNVFLDSEAKFKIHDLEKIVEQTRHFIFILTPGIFLSKWCLEELKSAVANKKQITIVRELAFSLPEILPSEWMPFESVLRSPDQLVWLAEYNQSCINAIRVKTGPSTKDFKTYSCLIPKMVQEIEQTGTLRSDIMQDLRVPLPFFLHSTKDRRDLLPKIKKMVLHNSSFDANDDIFLKDIKLPNLEDISGLYSGSLNPLSPCIDPSKFKALVLGSVTDVPRLENIEEYQADTDNVQDIINTCGPNLKSLKISSWKFSLQHCSQEQLVKSFPKLEKLHLWVQSIKGFALFFPTLTHLDVNQTIPVEHLQKLANLTSLRVAEAYDDPNCFMKLISQAGIVFHKITSFELFAKGLSRADISVLAKSFPNIETLSLSNYEIPPEDDPFNDLIHCKNLRSLNIENVQLIRATEEQQMLSLLPVVAQLEKLAVRFLPAAFIEEISVHGEGRLKVLDVKVWPTEKLSMMDSPGFANLESLTVVANYPELISAVLKYKKLDSVVITGDCLPSLASTLPQLRRLMIDNTTIEMEVMDMIVANGTRLETLKIYINKENAAEGTIFETCQERAKYLLDKLPNLKECFVRTMF